ncbi:hypothetical protein [Sphingomonas solaris]|uniref:Uncharacterized protein n=1 Tax=Alterirhizorhabdus solaris TaxID=2529389 RepID=A0A558R7L0_9SPHN|nr:hypothetical protein [Sphingomonas solaris]TVV75357.1 hypothetical protein FOY91_07170 [Sphingomonas solaris]
MDSTARRTWPGPATLRRLDPWLGPVSAVLLGFATAFFLIAMPLDVLAAVVVSVGLPPAVAESPVVLALVIALMLAAATWAGFHRLGRAGRVRPAPVALAPAAAPPVAAAPVLRRTDAHPDAPARRPIFAASDLGPPLDLIDPLPADDPRGLPAQPSVSENPASSPAASPSISPPPAIDPGHAEKTSVPDPPAAAFAYPTVSVAPAAATLVEPPPSLTRVMARLEAGLARKAVAQGERETNVTPLKREIPPFRGDLRDALDEIRGKSAGGP